MKKRIAEKITKREAGYVAVVQKAVRRWEECTRKERRMKLINSNHECRKALVILERRERRRARRHGFNYEKAIKQLHI